ncbi:hypothetical protein D3C75_505510 [compost metagenome]
MASSSGRVQVESRSLRASKMPTGKPISTQKNSEVSTRDRVTMASDQAPIRPIPTRETSVPSAMRPPTSCQAIRVKSPIIRVEGTVCSSWVMAPRASSTGARISWNTGRRFSTSQPMPPSTQVSSGTRACWKGSSQSTAALLSTTAIWLCQSAASVAVLPQGSSAVVVVAAPQGSACASSAQAGALVNSNSASKPVSRR